MVFNIEKCDILPLSSLASFLKQRVSNYIATPAVWSNDQLYPL